jgi:hypothetical protein
MAFGDNNCFLHGKHAINGSLIFWIRVLFIENLGVQGELQIRANVKL